MPPTPIRELRELTRYRKTHIEGRTRQAQRLDKNLQDAGVKLSSVASNILGKSGRDMLDALVAGTRDAEVLTELARGRLRTKIPALTLALVGRFGGGVPYHELGGDYLNRNSPQRRARKHSTPSEPSAGPSPRAPTA